MELQSRAILHMTRDISGLFLRYPRLTRQANVYATGTLPDYNPTSHGSLRPPTRITPKIDIHPLCNPLHHSIPSPPKPCDRFMLRCLPSLRMILRVGVSTVPYTVYGRKPQPVMRSRYARIRIRIILPEGLDGTGQGRIRP